METGIAGHCCYIVILLLQFKNAEAMLCIDGKYRVSGSNMVLAECISESARGGEQVNKLLGTAMYLISPTHALARLHRL